MDPLRAAIEAVNRKWMDAFGKGDSAGIGKLYTENCETMPPGSDVIVGRDGASKVFQGAMNGGVARALLITDEVGPMGAGDTAFERGHYTFYKKDGSIFEEGKYVVVWKKVNGDWQLYIDIWNTNKS